MRHAADAILRLEQAAYLDALEPARDPLLAEMEAFAAARRQPISGPEVAAFLAVAARAAEPRTILELGTNIGYGAIVLARAAGQEGRVVTIENDSSMVEIARTFVARAGLEERIEVRHDDALAALRTIPAPIDLVYIDCIKEDYPAYFDLVVPKLGDRGVILADNVLWKGQVADTTHRTPILEALRSFNTKIANDPRLRGVILPLGDGLAYAVRIRERPRR